MRIDNLYESSEDLSLTLEDQLKILSKLCKKYKCYHSFLKFMDGYSIVHSTARGQTPTKVIGVFENVTRKKPTSTPTPIHRELNKIMDDTFGHPYRTESIFAYPKRYLDGLMQQSLILFPKDGSECLYNTKKQGSEDFYARFRKVNDTLLNRLHDDLEDHGMETYDAADLSAEVDIVTHERKGQKYDSLAKFYMDIKRRYPKEQADIIKKVYIDGIRRFINGDIKKFTEVKAEELDWSHIGDAEIMMSSEYCIYLSVDHIKEQLDHYMKMKKFTTVDKAMEELKRVVIGDGDNE